MKLLTSFATMGLLAAQSAYAAEQQVHIPFDCYKESERVYGKKQGNRKSDIDLISGLDAGFSRLTTLTACIDNDTNLISGVTTSYDLGKPDFDREQGADYSPKRMNIIGSLSGIYEFNQQDGAGLADQQAASFQKLWWKRANPDDEEFSKLSRQEDYTNILDSNFQMADTDRNGKLNLAEFDRFYRNVRDQENRFGAETTEDNTDYEHENFGEKMMATFEACCSLNGSEETCSKSDFTRTEDIMRTWYSEGKMDVTGSIYRRDSPSAQWLSHTCKTITLDYEDSITYLRVNSGVHGVETIEMQTKKQPYWSVGNLGSRDYAFTNRNWIKTGAEFGKEMFGLFGYSDATTGMLNDIGFIEKDTDCVNRFSTALGASYTWNSPMPGTELTEPIIPSAFDEAISKLKATEEQIKDGKMEEHEHEDLAEVALVVITVLVYVALMALVAVLIYQYCQEKKSGGNAGKFN